VRRRGKVLLRQCGPDERWSGLWDFPRFAVSASKRAVLRAELIEKVRQQVGVEVEPGEKLTTIKHGVTRYRITLGCYEASYIGRAKPCKIARPLRWVHLIDLVELPLSVTGRKIARLINERE
jgi:A/G-specific adenine glycosylase